jgi:membrane-associated phospholipid phosphatase
VALPPERAKGRTRAQARQKRQFPGLKTILRYIGHVWTPGFRLLFAAFVILFAALAVGAYFYPVFPGDQGATTLVQSFRPDWLVQAMTAVSFLGDDFVAFVLVVAAGVVVFVLKQRVGALLLLLTSWSDVFGTVLRSSINRPRPGVGVEVLYASAGASFPSGHASHFVAFYGFVAFLGFVYLKRAVYRYAVVGVAGIVIIAVGYSRVFLGDHWVSDVIGGYLLGAIILMALMSVEAGVAHVFEDLES